MTEIPNFLLIAFRNRRMPASHKLAHLNSWRTSQGLAVLDEFPAIQRNAKDAKRDHSQNGEKTTEPGLIRKAVSLTRAVVKHVASGASTVGDAEVERRMVICSTCEFFNRERVKCSKCGCSLGVKTRWKTADCPIGKWSEATE